MSDTKGQTNYQSVIDGWRKELEAGQDAWVDALYEQNLDKFVGWGSRTYDLDLESLKDIFQQAVVSMYENIRYNRINQLASSPSTYLFGIGKNLILKELRKNKKVETHRVRLQEHWSFVTLDQHTLEDTFAVVQQFLQEMKEPCKSIIQMFYIQAMSIKNIASKLKYNSQDVVKTQKSRCMKTLREAVQNKVK